jgi:hypothetical protein
MDLVAVASEISCLSILGEELFILGASRSPSLIIFFRFGYTVSVVVLLECWTPKTRVYIAVGVSLILCLQAEIYIAWGIFILGQIKCVKRVKCEG